MSTTPRTTLWSVGSKGSRDWMRVLRDDRADCVEVKFKDAAGRTRKRLFPNDPQGRRDAIRWAQTVHAERIRGGARVNTDHATLWAAYQDSPAWDALRVKSRIGYAARWDKWTRYVGTTRPEDVTIHTIETFVQRAKQVWAINQVRQIVNTVRIVYRWGHARSLIREHAFLSYTWSTPDGAVIHEPAEYTPDEFPKLLAQLSPQSSRTWRASVAILIGGHHGPRANAALHLRWEDPHDGPLIQDGSIVWPRAFQKNKKALRQPLTWDLIAALETARYWRRVLGYEGPWVICGGTRASRGMEPSLKPWELDPKHKRVGVKGRRKVGDRPYTYQSLWQQLRNAEDAADIPHRDYRAFHGLRKHAAGNVADVTGDARLAMEWIGDDIKQAPKYLKTRSERMERAARAATSSVPEVSGTPTPSPTTTSTQSEVASPQPLTGRRPRATGRD